ncbi:MAG: hypothetical protein NXI31_02140 [bacterium]|nr:hypothetical protein [bacterium]
MRRTTLLLLTTALVPLAPAQEPAESERPGQQQTAGQETAGQQGESPVIRVRSASAGTILDIAGGFGFRDDLPDLPEDGHYELVVDADREVAVRAGSGAVGYLEFRVDPGAVMELFADEIKSVKGIAQGVAVMAMTQQGFSAKEATGMMRSLFEFPYLLESAELVLPRNPKQFEDHGLEMRVAVTAQPGTQVAALFERLVPAGEGAPALPRDDERLLGMQLSLANDALGPLMGPFLDFGLSFSYTDPEARKQAKKLSKELVELYDGGFAFAISKGMQMEALYGFFDSDKLATKLHSDEYHQMMVAQQPGRDIEVEIERSAFEHRGSKFMRMTMYNDGPPNPMMPNDEMNQFFGAVGRYLVMGGSKERAQKLAETIAEQQLKRGALAGGAIMTLEMNLLGWLDAMKQAMPVGRAAKKMPKRVNLQLFAKQRTLSAVIRAQ